MNKSQFPQLNDAAWLTEHYVDQQLNAIEVAQLIGCERGSVVRALKRYGIDIRSYGNRRTRYPQLDNREWLAEQLATKTLRQIAGEQGVSVGAVGYLAKKHGFVRSQARSDAVREAIAKRYPEGRWGENTGNWRGGRRQLASGYVQVYMPGHPRAAKRGAVMEHILVMEQVLGRYLEPDEIVHHINHVKDDNHPENLVVKKKGAHIREHFDAGKNMDAALARIEQLEQFIRKAGLTPPD